MPSSQMDTLSTVLCAQGWALIGREGLRISQQPRIELPGPRVGYNRLFHPQQGLIIEIGPYSLSVWHALTGTPGRARSATLDDACRALTQKGAEGLKEFLAKQMR